MLVWRMFLLCWLSISWGKRLELERLAKLNVTSMIFRFCRANIDSGASPHYRTESSDKDPE